MITKYGLEKFICNCSKEVYRRPGSAKPCPACGGKMQLKIMRRNNHHWSGQEIDFLRENYKTKLAREIASEMGMTECQVKSRLFVLGLRLPKKETERRKKLGQFPKGHVPQNKGLKGIHSSPGSEFKKGNKPTNTKYDGCISIRKLTNGRPENWIRISEGKWERYNRWLWKKYKGEIPDGMLVALKDGNPKNIKIENLKLITKKENLLRNRPNDLYANRDYYWHNSEKYIASTMTRDKKLIKDIVKNHPELISIKRKQLLLRKEIKNARKQAS